MQWFRFSLVLLVLGSGLSTSARAGTDASINGLALGELQRQLAAFVAQPRFEHGDWGIKAVSLASGETIFEHQGGHLLKPASNTKLFTGALALDAFGSDYRIRTSVYAARQPDAEGRVGDLVIYGRGDPSIAARFRNGDYEGLLRPLAQAIAEAGVKVVEGDLIGDETFFHGPPFGSNWAWDDLQYYYGAQVSALTVQDNVIDIILRPGASEGDPCSYILKPKTDYVRFVNRTTTGNSNSYPATAIYRPLGEAIAYMNGSVPLGHSGHEESVTVPDPALWFVTLLTEELERVGVKIEGGLVTRSWPADPRTDVSRLQEVAHVESVPMSEMVERMMKPSQNLYAQLLFLQAGAAQARPDDTNTFTEDLGLRALRAFAEEAGIPREELLLEEGSGLSRGGLVTPNAIVQLLVHMTRHPEAEAFRDALPIAGTEGTMRYRLRTSELKGNMRAKTGTLRHVNALSGYLTTVSGEPVAFSILLNAYSGQGHRNPRAELDKVATLLWQLDRRGVSNPENESTGRETTTGALEASRN